MARFTANSVEIQHLKDTEQEIATVASQNGWRVKVVLVNGEMVVGSLSGTNNGNNAGRDGLWMYCGDVTIVDDTGNANTIDRLEIIKVDIP